MSLRSIRNRAVAVSLMLALPLPALAQNAGNTPDPTSLEGKRAEGKARYERGVEAYSAGRFKDAIDLFLQADALAPSAALSFNIARAYEKISDDASTLQWYRDFRRRAPDAKNGAEVDEHIHQLEGVLAKKGVQQLTVLSTPYGATVVVDDQPVGVTPYTGQLPPGAHRVVLSLRGYADSEHQVQLAADHAQYLQVPLVPARERPNAPSAPGAEPSAEAGLTGAASTGGTPQDHPDGGRRFGVWPYVGLGAGALALGGALGFELARRSAETAAKDDHTQLGYKDKLDKEQSRQQTARILGVVGGALVVAGGTLLVIDLTTHPKRSEQARLGFACLPGACAFDLRGQF